MNELPKEKELPRVVIYGTGGYYQSVKSLLFDAFIVVALVDSLKGDEGLIMDGCRVIDPDSIHKIDFDYIVIASSYEYEIKEVLNSKELKPEVVKSIGDFPQLLNEIEQQILPKISGGEYKIDFEEGKTTLAFIMNSMLPGGAEKALVSLLQHFDSEKYQVIIFLFEYNGFYLDKIPNEIKVFNCFSPNSDPLLTRIWLKYKDSESAYQNLIVHDSDVCIAFIEGWATKILSGRKKAGKIAWVHTNLVTNPWTKECFLSDELERSSYESMDRVVFVSEDSKLGYESRFIHSKKNIVIPNVIDITTCAVRQPTSTAPQRLVYVGRLSKVKGVIKLLAVFTRLASKYDYLNLLVIGDGEERRNLESYVSQHALNLRVKFTGFIEAPFSLTRTSDIFVNPSDTEGYPLAVAEALINELPVIATKCTGNCEILKNGEFGELADNSEQGLHQSIEKLLSKPKEFLLTKKKSALGKSQFKAVEVVQKVNDLIKSVVMGDKY
jgi:glycosyltransferase involved in cell wall biosynthesis